MGHPGSGMGPRRKRRQGPHSESCKDLQQSNQGQGSNPAQLSCRHQSSCSKGKLGSEGSLSAHRPSSLRPASRTQLATGTLGCGALEPSQMGFHFGVEKSYDFGQWIHLPWSPVSKSLKREKKKGSWCGEFSTMSNTPELLPSKTLTFDGLARE